VIDVRAGDTVTMVWHHTLDGDKPNDKSDPVDPGHLGPTLAYMAKVDDARTEKVTGLKCKLLYPRLLIAHSKMLNQTSGFKVHEDGWDGKNQWGVTKMYKNRGKVSFKVPSCIQSGQYVLRTRVKPDDI
jgi:lytic cellulose monooxygenase (C4-dehydrogenating)